MELFYANANMYDDTYVPVLCGCMVQGTGNAADVGCVSVWDCVRYCLGWECNATAPQINSDRKVPKKHIVEDNKCVSRWDLCPWQSLRCAYGWLWLDGTVCLMRWSVRRGWLYVIFHFNLVVRCLIISTSWHFFFNLVCNTCYFIKIIHKDYVQIPKSLWFSIKFSSGSNFMIILSTYDRPVIRHCTNILFPKTI